MKACLVTSGTQWGGVEVHLAALADTLASRGSDVTILELNGERFARHQTSRAGVTVTSVRLSAPVPAVGLLEWHRTFAPRAADVCVFSKPDFDVGSWRMDLAIRLAFRRYVTIEQLARPMPRWWTTRHAGGLVPGGGLWWQRLRLRRRLRAPWPHAVICVSDAVGRPLLEDYGFKHGKVTTIFNGIDVPKLRRTEASSRAIRAAWGVPRDALVFGALGRLHPMKGHERSVSLFARVQRMLPAREMRLVLVGDGDSREALARLAHAEGVGDRVLFPGFTSRPAEAYPGFDVFLMPSHNEGLPIALVEAMACECCPIAMGVGGVPEVITEPQYGWLVAPGDEAGFCDAMAAAAAMSRSERAAMGIRARAHAVARFDSKRLLARTAALVETLAGSNHAHTAVDPVHLPTRL